MKRKHFFTYLNESIALNLPSQLKKDEQSLGLNTREKSVRDIPTMYNALKDFKKDVLINDQDVNKVKNLKKIKQKRASILKQHNLKIENGEIVNRNKADGQLDLFQNINISRNENDFAKEIKEKITELSTQIEKDDTEYRKNLKILLKRFFSIGGKMPKRYLYLPVSNTINISQIEKINNNSHLDMLLKIKSGSFVDLKGGDEDLIDYLVKSGYKLTKEQYMRNVCININGKEVPIDQELNNIAIIKIEQKKKALEKQTDPKLIERINLEIQKRENFDESYLNTIKKVKEDKELLTGNVIILTWVPRLIMAQSTNTIWKSCMSYHFDGQHGSNNRYVGTGMQQGTFIAWLVDLEDRHVFKPIARTLLKPFELQNDNYNREETFYWPSVIYTSGGQENIINLFKRTLSNYCFFKQKDIIKKHGMSYTILKRGVYNDNDGEDFNILKSKVMDADDIYNFLNDEDNNNVRDYLRNSPNLNIKHLTKIINSNLIKDDIFLALDVIKKIFDLKSFYMLNRVLYKQENKMFLLNFIFALDEIEFYFPNINNFKYFLSLYPKDVFKDDNIPIRRGMESINQNGKNIKFLKASLDYFGESLYGNDKKIAKQLATTYANKTDIFYIFNKLNLDLDFENINFNFCYMHNPDLFFAIIDKSKKVLVDDGSFINVMHMMLQTNDETEKEKYKKINHLLDKVDVKIDENQRDITRIFFIYSMISRNENFIKIHSKMMSKNIDIKKHFYPNMMNIVKDDVVDLMSNLILIKEPEAKTLFKAFLTYVIEKSIVRSAVIFKIFSNLIIKKANIDLILDFLMSVPSLNFHQSDFGGYGYDDYCDNVKDKEKIKKLNLLISEKMFTENEKLSLGKSPALFIETLKLEDYDFFEKKFLNEKGRIDINDIYDFYYKMVARPLDKFFEQIDSSLKFFVKYQDRIDDKGLLIGQRLKDRIETDGSNLGFDFIVFLNILKKMAKLGLIKQEDFEMGFSIFKDNIFKYKYYQHVRNFIYACLGNVTKYDKKHYEEVISILGQKISYTNSDDFTARFSDFPFSMFSFEHKHENIKIFFDIFDEKTKNMFIFTYIIKSFSFRDDAIERIKSIIRYLNFEKPFRELINPFVLDNSSGSKTRILIEIMNQYTFFNDMINKEDFVMALTSGFGISLWDFLSTLLHKNDIKNNKIEKAITDSLERIHEDIFGILYGYYLNIFGKQTMKSIAQKNKVIQRKAIDNVQKNIINKRFHRSMAKKKK